MSSGQWDPSSYYSWPPDASTGGYIWLNVSLTKRLAKCEDDLTSYWTQVNWTYVSTIVGHQMPLLGGTSDWMSAWQKANQMWRWPVIILNSGQLDLCQYYCWPPDASTGGVCLTECQPDSKDDQMLRWPDVPPVLATRCLYWRSTSEWMAAWPKG